MTTDSGNLNPMVKLRTCIKTAVAWVTAAASGQQQWQREIIYTLMFVNIWTWFTPATCSAETVSWGHVTDRLPEEVKDDMPE
jgi:hypothetical protein